MGQSLTTPSLHHAIQYGNTKHVKYLLKKNPTVDVNEKHEEKTALYLAITEQDEQVIDLLLEHGADPNVKCTIEKSSWAFPWSAMHEVCWQGMSGILDKLIVRGGDINLEAHQSMTPLHVAAWFGHKDVIKKLLDLGCDVNHLDRFKESAIVMPICQGDYESVRLLLMAGSKLSSRSWANIRKIQCKYDLEFRHQIYTRHGPFSLFTLAIKYAWLNIAILLLQHGFNPNKYSVMDVLEDLKGNVGSIDDNGRKLIQCFLAAGYRFRASDERELSYLETLCTTAGVDNDKSHDHRSHDQGTQEQELDAHEVPTVVTASLDEVTGQATGPAAANHRSYGPTSAGDYRTVKRSTKRKAQVTTAASIELANDSQVLNKLSDDTKPSEFTQSSTAQPNSSIPMIVFNPDPRIQSLSSAVDKDFLDWLLSQEGFREPISLKQACRITIRSHLRVCRSQASVLPPIYRLQLPPVLRDYLTLSEFGDPLVEEQSNAPSSQTYLDTEKLYFAMPRRVKQQQVHVIVQFWMTSCCCGK